MTLRIRAFRRRGDRGGRREQVAGPDRVSVRPDNFVRVDGYGGQAAPLGRGVQHVAGLGHRARRGGARRGARGRRGGGDARGGRGGRGGALAVAAAGAPLQEALLPARALGRVERRAAAGRGGLGAAGDVTPAHVALRRVPVRALAPRERPPSAP